MSLKCRCLRGHCWWFGPQLGSANFLKAVLPWSGMQFLCCRLCQRPCPKTSCFGHVLGKGLLSLEFMLGKGVTTWAITVQFWKDNHKPRCKFRQSWDFSGLRQIYEYVQLHLLKQCSKHISYINGVPMCCRYVWLWTTSSSVIHSMDLTLECCQGAGDMLLMQDNSSNGTWINGQRMTFGEPSVGWDHAPVLKR